MKVLKLILMILIIMGIFLCGGCATWIETNAHEKHVTGWGIDVNFYPFPSIRIGYYDYILKIEK